MTAALVRRRLLQGAAAACATSLLPSARACEFFASTLRITHPWTRATKASASYAIVCIRFDEVLRDERLIAVETPVSGGAQRHDVDKATAVDFAIPSGQTTLLGEGELQLRLVDLTMDLELGRSYPMRLVFEQGGVVNATLSIDYGRFS